MCVCTMSQGPCQGVKSYVLGNPPHTAFHSTTLHRAAPESRQLPCHPLLPIHRRFGVWLLSPLVRPSVSWAGYAVTESQLLTW